MHRVTAVVSVLALVLVALVAAGRHDPGTLAQDATPATAGHPVVGSWLFDNPDFQPSLDIFHADGTYFEVDADGGIAVGSWEATGERTANLTIVYLFPDESGATATLTVRGSAEVAADGQSFTATYTLELTLPDGTSTGEYGPGTGTATRLAVEPMGEPVGSIADFIAQFEEPAAAPAP